ncbi:AlpA family phage regulatory protein [Citrobacter freundii]
MAPYHLLRIKQVEARTGLHHSQIYAWMKEGHFPQSIKIDPARVAWLENEMRGSLTFIERAPGVCRAREFYQRTSAVVLSQTQMVQQLRDDGFPVTQWDISKMESAFELLLPHIPDVLRDKASSGPPVRGKIPGTAATNESCCTGGLSAFQSFFPAPSPVSRSG